MPLLYREIARRQSLFPSFPWVNRSPTGPASFGRLSTSWSMARWSPVSWYAAASCCQGSVSAADFCAHAIVADSLDTDRRKWPRFSGPANCISKVKVVPATSETGFDSDQIAVQFRPGPPSWTFQCPFDVIGNHLPTSAEALSNSSVMGSFRFCDAAITFQEL